MPKIAIHEDHQLIKSISQCDESAYESLYDKYADKMLGLACVMLKNKTDAEDIIHDVFIEVWNKASSYRSDRGTVISWLMLRVRSRCLDRFRMLKTLRKNTQTQVLDVHYEDDNEKKYEIQQQKSTLQHALDKLSQKQRTVIEMTYFKGLTCAEISRNCDIPLGTVKTRLMSAMLLMRTFVLGAGVKI